MEIDHTEIDWEMLRQQKQTLIYLAENKRGTRIKYDEAVDITGILHLIDYIQDTAVDGGYVPEVVVFQYEDENKEDAEAQREKWKRMIKLAKELRELGKKK